MNGSLFFNNYTVVPSIGFLLFIIIPALIGIFLFVFWLMMLIDAIKTQKEDKTMWVLLIIFLNVLGAILYYFIGKKEGDKA